jgi:AhpD family alkylhydroperoxidase
VNEPLALLAALAAIPAPDTHDPAVAEFAAQFALDVASLDGAQRTAFLAATGDRAFTVVQQIYVHDMVPRARRLLTELWVPEEVAQQPSRRADDADSWATIQSFLTAVARLDALDPTLTELVRLRGARLHDCAVCTSRRSQDALDHGADETLFDAVDHWPTSVLPLRAKAALGLVDALVLAAPVPPDVRDHLEDAEIVEVVLDVVRNAANKIAVALGADAATVTDGFELFTTDTDGTLTVVGVSR